MLPSKHRLKKKRVFDKVFKEGSARKGRFLLVKSVENGLEHPRFGFVVSKKVSPKATGRNKIKRRLREATRTLLPALEKERKDYILVAFPRISEADYQEIEKEVEKLLT